MQGLRDPNTHYLNTEKYLRVHLIGTLGYAYVILHKEESFLQMWIEKAFWEFWYCPLLDEHSVLS